MKHTLLRPLMMIAIILFTATTACARPASQPAVEQQFPQADTIEVMSQAMGRNIKNVVIMPDGYHDSDLQFPVLYLLHGAYGCYSDWSRKADLDSLASHYGVIIVCPDGQDSWYFDSPVDPTMQFETYVSRELVEYIDSHYRTHANRFMRAITGLSMGGHGALFLAFRHPDVFWSCGSMSGNMDITQYPDKWHIKDRLGERDDNPQRWRDHAVCNLVDQVKACPLQPAQNIIIDDGLNDIFIKNNIALHDQLVEAGIDHDFTVRPGRHSWDYWVNSLDYHMMFFDKAFRRGAAIMKQEPLYITTTMNNRPKILIIYTGGTIGMIENPETHALQPFDFSHLMDNVPKVKKLHYEIDNFQFEPPIDSSNMDPSHWRDIALAIEERYDRYDGFVVLHGTDTMAFTASALSFMLENLSKPVIITGSQLPIGEVRTDGEENLITALQVAAAIDEKGRPRVQEVAILFENYLWRGNRATKMSADNFNAFKSFNYPELAEIGLDIEYNPNALRTMPPRPLKVCTDMDTNVMFLELNPGMTEQTLDHLLNTPGIKGIVLKTYGAGNTPNHPWFIKSIRQAVDRGVVIVNVTQCVNGGVNCSLYETGKTLLDAGVISGYDITSEAAITKLMFLFGQRYTPSMVKKYMVSDLCGEVTIP